MTVPLALRRQFASDNYAGVCPEAWAALAAANHGHAPGYGADDWTRAAKSAIQRVFDIDCEVFFVFNGTAANALALASLCRPSDAVVCHALAHVNVDECGAPEFFSGGAKLLTINTPDAKLTPAAIAPLLSTPRDDHASRLRVLALTQSTEMGTVYSAAELDALCSLAHSTGMKVQLDGARFANAVASLQCHPADIAWRAGVDVLCLGGTKNGLPFGEAIVFFDHDLADEFGRRRKQGGQLASKMRFLAAPWLGVLENGAWLRHAAHANAMAQRLAQGIDGLTETRLLAPVQANGVFIDLPERVIIALRDNGWLFYTFVGTTGARLMCAWDTTEEDVDAFIQDIRACIERFTRKTAQSSHHSFDRKPQ